MPARVLFMGARLTGGRHSPQSEDVVRVYKNADKFFTSVLQQKG